ncbi:quinon protein alcohol dehydrogenase-like superfamily [Fimicolochytrium jonesii]|uniref:quinon protein alcohol dehydrogenase-like superfamily n=1 Tax=Fimicolochytrium jonesii TaxID=1396493 RepID=UPI0022FE6A45|nr:quinon protein alcohol dehydrogenase-like superfamily [Fimicolochytrium jonesii]KAI8818219.1 quinon protein alcohol dehydrogenase-like superfamily [Fimicolochytrium jonesii]
MSVDTAEEGTGRPFRIHRCKAVKYNPAGVVSLSVVPETVPSNSQGGRISRKDNLVACARTNGDIELWNPRGKGWFLERTIPGSKSSPIEAVVWVHQNNAVDDSDFDTPEERKAYLKSLRQAQPRLISAGLDGRIVEWDTTTLKPHRVAEVGGGAIWCAAPNTSHTRLAVGCEDGHVRVLDISDDQLVLHRLLEKSPTRIMSIAWHPNGQFLVAGGADSSIRKIDVKTGRTVQRMTTATVPGEETIVWDLKVLKDGTVVTGDSMGHVTYWDWQSGTASNSTRAHEADVLCLAVNKAGTKVWSSGVDRRVVQFSLVDSSTQPSGEHKEKRKGSKSHDHRPGAKHWILSGEKRYHSHDVRALALLEGRPHDALISGGLDTTLIVSSPLTEFPFLKQYRMASFPHRPIVQITKSGSKLMLARFQDHIKVWRLGEALAPAKVTAQLPTYAKVDHQRPTYLFTIKPKFATNLTAAAISEDGEWVAVSDMNSVKLFRVVKPAGNGQARQDEFKIKRVKAFELRVSNVIKGAHNFVFTPDSLRLIVAGADSIVYVVDLTAASEDVYSIVKQFEAHRGDEGSDHGDEDAMEIEGVDSAPVAASKKLVTKGGREMVVTLSVSGDGQWLASGDMLNRIHVFNLDSLKHHATLPIFSTLHTTLTFHPTSPTLITTTASNEFYLYDCEEARLTDWSREYSQRLPLRWLNRKEVVLGVAFDPLRPAGMILWAANHFTFIDLEQPLGPRDALISAEKRRRVLQRKARKAAKWARMKRAQPQADEQTHVNGTVAMNGTPASIRRKGVNGQPNGHHVIDADGAIVIDSSDDEDLEDDTDPLDAHDLLLHAGETNGVSHADTDDDDDIDETTRAGTKRPHTDDADSDAEPPSTPASKPIPRGQRVNGILKTPTPVDAAKYNTTLTFSPAFNMEHRYGPIMGLAFVSEHDLAVVELPALAVMNGVAEGAFQKHTYGT